MAEYIDDNSDSFIDINDFDSDDDRGVLRDWLPIYIPLRASLSFLNIDSSLEF